MENYNQQEFSNYTVLDSQPATGQGTVAKKFMANVFLWMFAALGISAFFAFLFASSPSLMVYLVSSTGRGLSGLGWVVMLAPIGFVLLMSAGFQRLSAPAMTGLFLAYSAINGISFSFILLAYQGAFPATCT